MKSNCESADTYQMRRDFVREQRARRNERRQRTAAEQVRRASSSSAAHGDAAERIEDMSVIVTARDVGMDSAAGTTKAVRPRRLKEAVDAGVPELAPLSQEEGMVTGNGAGHTEDE